MEKTNGIVFLLQYDAAKYDAAKSAQYEAAAVPNLGSRLVEERSRSLKGHAQLLLDWLKNAVVGGEVATRVECCICRVSLQ